MACLKVHSQAIFDLKDFAAFFHMLHECCTNKLQACKRAQFPTLSAVLLQLLTQGTQHLPGFYQDLPKQFAQLSSRTSPSLSRSNATWLMSSKMWLETAA